MTKQSLFLRLKTKISDLRVISPEEAFQLALDAMLTEFRRRVGERLDEMRESRGKLVRSTQFQNSGNQFTDRLGVYKPLVKKIGEDYIDCLKTILLPNCGLISIYQKAQLASEFQKIVVAQAAHAKDAEKKFAHSIGRQEEINSVFPILESIFYSENSRVRDFIESLVKQANLTFSTKRHAERKKSYIQTVVTVAKKIFLGI
ncbi:MAG: hypothetical protein Q8K98_04895 [Bacteroidota bacterium]|nr:hypothetical protein [Bacteroidota bacterium]